MFLPTRVSEEVQETINQLPEEDRHKLVKTCVSAIMVLGQNRTPIKKTDLNRHLHHNYRINNAILVVANYELNKIFGMRLFEVENKSVLLLVNSSIEFSHYATHSKSMSNELTVLYFILMQIFASSDEAVCEDEIENALSPLGFSRDALKARIDTLVKKHYLVLTKDSFQQDVKLYTWGPRAMAEVDPDNFFECFLNLVGEGSDRDWPELKKRIDKLKSIHVERL